MSSESSSIPPTRPTQFVEGQDEQGNPTLEVLEGVFEQTYRVRDDHTEALLLALIRSRGLLPYRHARQRRGTVCVRATLSEHDALWSSFEEFSAQLRARLSEVTCAFLREHLETEPR